MACGEADKRMSGPYDHLHSVLTGRTEKPTLITRSNRENHQSLDLAAAATVGSATTGGQAIACGEMGGKGVIHTNTPTRG